MNRGIISLFSNQTWFSQVLVQERKEFLDSAIGNNSMDCDGMEMDNWPYKIARLINLALKFMAEVSSQVRVQKYRSLVRT